MSDESQREKQEPRPKGLLESGESFEPLRALDPVRRLAMVSARGHVSTRGPAQKLARILGEPIPSFGADCWEAVKAFSESLRAKALAFVADPSSPPVPLALGLPLPDLFGDVRDGVVSTVEALLLSREAEVAAVLIERQAVRCGAPELAALGRTQFSLCALLAMEKNGAQLGSPPAPSWNELLAMAIDDDSYGLSRNGSLDGVLWLLARGAKAGEIARMPWRHMQKTPLQRAVHSGSDRLAIVRALAAAGADLDADSPDESAPLHCAMRAGDWGMAEELVRLGADFNALSENGLRPLDEAKATVNEGHPDPEIGFLWAKNAAALIQEEHGARAAQSAMQQAKNWSAREGTPPMVASSAAMLRRLESIPARIEAASIQTALDGKERAETEERGRAAKVGVKFNRSEPCAQSATGSCAGARRI
jgi:hypothetical protein